MKLQAVLFTTFVAFATVNCHFLPDFGKGPLHEDIQYFLDMIPMEDVISTVLKYAADDAEFQDFLKYFSTTEFMDMIVDVEAMPEFRRFANYLQNNGVFIYDELNKLNKVIGIPAIHQYNYEKKIIKTLKNFTYKITIMQYMEQYTLILY